MKSELRDFVRRALAKNASRADITSALRKAGWGDECITPMLASYADTAFVVPVPTPSNGSSVRDGFFYAVMFSALYMLDYNCGAVLFALVNKGIPDALQPLALMNVMGDLTRWYLASILVSLPIFLGTFYVTQIAPVTKGIRRNSRVRRILTYLTLYIAAMTLMSDMSSLIASALGGELTSRFFAKVVIVAVIGGCNLAYFYWDINDKENG